MNAHHLPGLIVTDHTFTLPLDHQRPQAEQIAVFAREVVAPGKAAQDQPWLVFFQGGPGFGALRPESNSGWLKRALKDYRVLLLDQRGTGLSSPITHQTITRLKDPQAQADYLKHFRADSIVRDAEMIRKQLLGPSGRWRVLGQSYGGFCIVHYLSIAPEGLKAALITGGLPPLEGSAEDVYCATYRRLLEKNERYYARYPEDVERVWKIINLLEQNKVRLPGGGLLTPRRFLQLGIDFGASDGFEKVHYLIESAFVGGDDARELGYPFLRAVENAQRFETNPIYAILHEAIYCQETASNWAAQRVHETQPEFAATKDGPLFFTGEMVYPWMFEDYKYLQPFKEAAHLLAAFQGWSTLYHPQALAKNSVPCAAVIYADDMYVERAFSEETARAIKGTKVWLTNEYEHNGLRADGERILSRLLEMVA